MSIQTNEVVHFATSNYTACNQHIVGGTFIWSEEANLSTHGSMMLHTADVEQVTCEACKKSVAYLKTLEEDYD